MGTNFNWQTDERWHEAPEVPPPAPRPPRRRSRLLLLLLIPLLFAAAFGGYRLIDTRAAAGLAAEEAALLAAHETVLRAARNQDADLLAAVVDPAQSPWAENQLKLADAGWLLDRTPWGWRVDTIPEQRDLALAPDLQTAVITATHTVQPAGDSSLRRLTFRFQYRRAADQWLLSNIEDPGAVWIRRNSIPYTLTYRERDAAVGAPLAQRLDETLGRLCAPVRLACGESFALEIQFTDEPAALLNFGAPYPRLEEEEAILFLELPSPALFGRPDGSAATTALVDLYLERTLRAVAARQVDYRCCRQAALFDAALTALLAEIEVTPAPGVDHAAAADINGLAPYWQAESTLDLNSPPPGVVVALIRFLEAEGYSPARQLTLFSTAKDATPLDFVRRILPPDLPAAFTGDLWRDFHLGRAALNGEPFPNPTQDLALLCQDNDGVAIYRYAVAGNPIDEGNWERTHLVGRSDVFLRVLPDDDVVLLQGFEIRSGPDALVIVQDDGVILLDQRAFGGPTPRFSAQADPTGRYLAGIRVDGGLRERDFVVADRTDCTPGSCPLRETLAFPIWSPDGRRTLLEDTRSPLPARRIAAEYPLYLADADGGNPLRFAAGTRPFWLDSRRVAFIEYGGGGAQNRVAVIDLEEPLRSETLVDLPTLQAAVPDPAPDSHFLLVHAFINRADPRQLYVTLQNQRLPEERHLLLVSGADVGYVTLLPENVAPELTSAAATGRWLSFGQPRAQFDRDAAIYVYDAYRDNFGRLTAEVRYSHTEYNGADWSADGRLLVTVTRSEIEIFSPDLRARSVLIPAPGTSCAQAFWVNPDRNLPVVDAPRRSGY